MAAVFFNTTTDWFTFDEDDVIKPQEAVSQAYNDYDDTKEEKAKYRRTAEHIDLTNHSYFNKLHEMRMMDKARVRRELKLLKQRS